MNNKNTQGRTYPDLIAENPWKVVMIVLAILLIILFFVSRNIPVRIWGIEIGRTNVYIHDTIVRYDTIYIKENIETLNAKKDAIKVQSINQNGGQTANQITNN